LTGIRPCRVCNEQATVGTELHRDLLLSVVPRPGTKNSNSLLLCTALSHIATRAHSATTRHIGALTNGTATTQTGSLFNGTATTHIGTLANVSTATRIGAMVNVPTSTGVKVMIPLYAAVFITGVAIHKARPAGIQSRSTCSVAVIVPTSCSSLIGDSSSRC
jgi:hypothetical protein